MCHVFRRRKKYQFDFILEFTLCFILKKVHVLKNFQKKSVKIIGGKRLPQDKLKRHFLKTLFCEWRDI